MQGGTPQPGYPPQVGLGVLEVRRSEGRGGSTQQMGLFQALPTLVWVPTISCGLPETANDAPGERAARPKEWRKRALAAGIRE